MNLQSVTQLSQPSELAAAFLQGAITAGLALICAYLHARYRKPYFAAWTLAFFLYALRLVAIIIFLLTEDRGWLYWHQVITGWTALALLWASLVFSQQLEWRREYWLAGLFPLVWSYLAIYRLDNFLLAAGPAVLFLSLATAWTGFVFLQHNRSHQSRPAAALALAFFLWSAHHLDYPFLRARGAWNPWGYYLDILLLLIVGGGILLLVLEDQQRGLRVLSSLSGDLQRGGQEELVLALLARPLTLPAVTGSALYRRSSAADRFTHGAGVCTDWAGEQPEGEPERAIFRVMSTGQPAVIRTRSGRARSRHAYIVGLPLFRGDAVEGVLVVVGRARDPFAALDEEFLIALGHQVGAALAHADLYDRLEERTEQLERLAARMVSQHEEHRARLARELHDETAQVFTAVRLQVALARESAEGKSRGHLDHAVELISSGIRSVRSVATDLRPALLDDLGLLPAIKAQVRSFGERTGISTTFSAPDALPQLIEDAEVAAFRAIQEGLSNVVRHAEADAVNVWMRLDAESLFITVEDDGRGIRDEEVDGSGAGGHMGIAGMRERITSLGGQLTLRSREGEGTVLEVSLPTDARLTSR